MENKRQADVRTDTHITFVTIQKNLKENKEET